MAIHDEVRWRNMTRVQDPSRATLGEIVASADADFGSGASYSPYGSLVDNSGAEQMVKIDEFRSIAEIPPPLPLGQGAVFDDLLGISLSEDEITEVYGSLKNGASIADVAVSYNITQDQAAGILTAMMNGSTPYDILHPVAATQELLMQQNMTMMRAVPLNMSLSSPAAMQTMQATGLSPSGGGLLQSSMNIGGMNIPIWMLGLGALALIMMLKKS